MYDPRLPYDFRDNQFATPEDVAAIYRPLTDEETTTAEGLIVYASTRLRVAVPGVDELIAGNPVKEALARFAVASAVKRVLQNPEALRSVGYAIDDYREDQTRDAAISAGGLYIDPADIVGLVRRSSIGMIRLRPAL